MSSPRTDSGPRFEPKSEKESICLCCFSTVRADRYTPLAVVQEIHLDLCLMGDRPPLLLQKINC